MKPGRTYLDWNATAPLRPEAREAMLAALDVVGNPSSVHAEGRRARRIIEDAREQVAALVGARSANVFFTSGATEGNNWVHGQPWRAVFYSGVEHVSVLAPVLASDGEKVSLPVRSDGMIDVEALKQAIVARSAVWQASERPALLTVQAANNETGVIQPLSAVADLARGRPILVACDGVQAAGRLPIKFIGSNLHYLTISSHKLGGPKGVGAVIMQPDAPLAPMLTGGGQERRQRPGTENVAAIAGFGAAAQAAAREVSEAGRTARLRDRLEADVLEAVPGALIVGRSSPRLANTSCISLPSRSAETLVAGFDLAGIAVSAGSACSSGKVSTSHVLEAMGLPPHIVRSAIRISIGPTTTGGDIAAFIAALRNIARRVVQAA